MFRPLANEWTSLEWFVGLESTTQEVMKLNLVCFFDIVVTRTAGLCYGAAIGESVEHGFLSLDIYRSPDALAALAAIRNLLASIASGKVDVSPRDLEGAKSQIAFESVESECTPSKAVGFSLLQSSRFLSLDAFLACRRATASSIRSCLRNLTGSRNNTLL